MSSQFALSGFYDNLIRLEFAAMGARPSIRDQLQRVRQDAIVAAVNRLLATKGYDAMTVDEVAADAGLAKASLYKLFPSKEDLAGAAMVGVLDRALAFVDDQRDGRGVGGARPAGGEQCLDGTCAV